jgi:hypothetical protein
MGGMRRRCRTKTISKRLSVPAKKAQRLTAGKANKRTRPECKQQWHVKLVVTLAKSPGLFELTADLY